MDIEIENLIKEALNGNTLSQYKYALLLYEGTKIPKNDVESYHFFEKAALNNHLDSIYYCGLLLENGFNSKADLAQAINYYQKAAKLNDLRSQLRLGQIFYSNNLYRDYEKSYKYYEMASKHKYPEAYYYLGRTTEQITESPDYLKAYNFFNEGSKLHDIRCIIKQASYLLEGTCVERNPDKAVLLYLEGSMLNNAECIYRLGLLMISGTGCPIDEKGGWGNIAKASNLGHYEATLKYGIYLCDSDDIASQKEGLKYLESSTSHKTGESFYYYAIYLLNIFEDDDEIKRNGIEALKKSIELDFTPAIYELSCIYLESEEVSEREEGMKLCEEASKRKYPSACLDYGLILYQNKSKRNDLVKVRELFQIAANDGIAEAQLNLGLLFYRGEGGEKNLNKAINYFKMASENDSAKAIYCLYDIYINGLLGTVDEEEALVYLKKGINLNDNQCMFAYANYYHDESDHQNLEKARLYYRLSGERGYIPSVRQYALMCYQGQGGEMDYRSARQWFQLGKEEGDLDCYYNLAFMVAHGQGGPVDLQYSRDLYLTAADRNHIPSMIKYAKMVESGEGGIQDVLEALEYFGKAGELGNTEALLCAAKIYSKVNPNSEMTRSTYQLACDLGNEDAKMEFSKILLKSQEAKDLVLCRSYLKQLNDDKYPGTNYLYGYVLANGIGGEKDLAKARKFFELSALEGNSMGKYTYGRFLREGIGGDVDLKESRYWIQEAADLGVEDAIRLLIEMGELGEGGDVMPELERKKYKRILNDEVSSDEEEYLCLIQ